MRKTALVAGVFYLITFVSIPTPFRGALLEVIVALDGIGTAVTLFPVVKRSASPSPPAWRSSRPATGRSSSDRPSCRA